MDNKESRLNVALFLLNKISLKDASRNSGYSKEHLVELKRKYDPKGSVPMAILITKLA